MGVAVRLSSVSQGARRTANYSGRSRWGTANQGAGVTVTEAERQGYILDSLTTIALQCPPLSPSPSPPLTPSTTIPWPTVHSQATRALSTPPLTPDTSSALPSPGVRDLSPAGSSLALLLLISSSKFDPSTRLRPL